MRPRLTIAASMIVVLFAGFALAALRTSTYLSASAAFTAAIASVAAATLAAIILRGRDRATCLGYATFGWTYLILTFLVWTNVNYVDPPPLLTTEVLTAVEPQMNAIYNGPPPGPPGFNSVSFRRVGHSLFAVLAGVAGALLGRLLFSRREATGG